MSENKKSFPTNKALSIAIVVLIAIALPLGAYYLGTIGFLVPDNNIGADQLRPATTDLTVEFDYTPGPQGTLAPSSTPEFIPDNMTGQTAAPTATPGAAAVAVVNATSLRLRQGPSQDDEIITTLTQGSTVTVLEEFSNGWWKVQTASHTGYADSAFLVKRTDY